MSQEMTAVTLDSDRIELHLTVKSNGHALPMLMLEQQVDVTVVFDYTRGYPAKLDGAPEDCEPGADSTFEIRQVFALNDMVLTDGEDNAGMSITLHPGHEITHYLPTSVMDFIEQTLREQECR